MININISDLRLDGGTQSRAAISEATVAEYAEAMEDPNTVFPPAIVYHDGRGYWLADGFHRVAAWQKIGRTEIPADVRQGDRRRAILHSCAANAAHGLRRTNADKRRAVLTLLEDEEWGQWSANKIAKQCGVSHTFVNGIKSSLETVSSETRTYTDKHGNETQMKTANIGGDEKPKSKPEQEEKAQENMGEAPNSDPAPIPQSKPDQEDPDAKLRAEFRSLTPDAIEDDWIGLRNHAAEQGKRIASQRREIADMESQIKELTDDDTGRTIGNLQRRVAQAEGRSKEHQTNAARLQRKVNAQKEEIANLRASLESQEIQL